MAPRIQPGKSPIFLQLPLELGGVRFGPFPGTVTLGSDNKRSQVVLDPSLGIFPVHVTIAQTVDGSFTVAPAGRECKVFLMPNDQPHVWPVTGPVQARAGDRVIVGTVSGPRFQLLSDQPVAAAPTAADVIRTARQTGGEQGLVQGVSQYIDGVFRPSGGGIGGEIQRRVIGQALATPGPVRTFYTLWTRFRGGTLFSPYFLVGLVFALIGLVGTGSLSCSGLLYVLSDVLGMHRVILLFVLACVSSAPPIEPVEPPFALVARPPPTRTIPDVQPADPATFVLREDGLGVVDEISGLGDEVTPGAVAVAEITSWTPDGTMWDSTWERREPARFVVGEEGVVPGWNEGVLGMRVGGVRQLLVPPALGFAHGISGRVPEGVPTITRIELVAVLVPPVRPPDSVGAGAAPTPPGDPPSFEVGGLVVRDLRAGDGPLLTGGVTARIDYVGWLADGTLFDTTWVRPVPFRFRYGFGTLRWESAFEGMQVGGRREIRVPAALAFGDEGRPPTIPPGADLVFAVDLRSIE